MSHDPELEYRFVEFGQRAQPGRIQERVAGSGGPRIPPG